MQEESKVGLLNLRTAQIHLTRRCNLQCLHCYSTSGPNQQATLAFEDLLSLFRILRSEGYELVSFSGGEPLVYPWIDQAIDEAVALGFRVNLISNGLRLNEGQLMNWYGKVDLIGISVDGLAERHDYLRNRIGAFDKVRQNLGFLRESGIPFAISHCVTAESIAELPELAQFAVKEGADHLQLHALNQTGKATELDIKLGLSDAAKCRLYLLARLMQAQFSHRLNIQVDLIPVATLLEQNVLGIKQASSLSELINPIVIREDRSIVPLSYAVSDDYAVCVPNEDWVPSIAAWKDKRSFLLERLLTKTLIQIENSNLSVVDWYQLLAEESRGGVKFLEAS